MIVNRQRRVRVPLQELEEFLGRVRQEFGLPQAQELTVCLVSDAEMARLNRRFRGRRGPTDVLSFPMGGVKEVKELKEVKESKESKESNKNNSFTSSTSSTSLTSFLSYLGDIAISVETARRNARRLGRGLPDELRILVLHGLLHLLGYDHETDGGQMDRLERRLRRRLGLGRSDTRYRKEGKDRRANSFASFASSTAFPSYLGRKADQKSGQG